jgi:uncharacterized SAM-binding protein YcdF (DUF218 family)
MRSSRPVFRRRRGEGLRRRLARLLGAFLLLFAIWLAGLIYFTTLIPDSVADPTTATDGIVVLTGGSDRLRAGLQLLVGGKAKRLLISGVYRDATLADLLQTGEAPAGLSQQMKDCCITVGYRAGNTLGNATETAEWAAANSIRSLRLVTADYHMPRSLLEFSHALPGAVIIPHPVFPEDVKSKDWWLWSGAAGQVISEYHKYLAALVRSWIDHLAGR